jgi:hypothetical protein
MAELAPPHSSGHLNDVRSRSRQDRAHVNYRVKLLDEAILMPFGYYYGEPRLRWLHRTVPRIPAKHLNLNFNIATSSTFVRQNPAFKHHDHGDEPAEMT